MTADKTHPKETRAETGSAANAVQVQCSLAIGAVNDPLEHEADAMADKVMRMQDVPAVAPAGAGGIQRKCAGCEEEEKVQRKPLASFIQRKESAAGTVASDAVSSQINASRGNGSTMDNNTQSFMQSRFGTDFSDVKIHTGGEAIQMNRELNAKAFTVGSDIYFNEGQYNPGSNEGKHLLAHELTHTVQQGSGIQKKIQRACADAAKASTSKQANIQLFVIADDDGANPTTAPKMIPVDRVWERCCIHMNVLDVKTIKDTSSKTLEVGGGTASAAETTLAANKVANAINIFTVSTFTKGGTESKNHSGGGRTFYLGSGNPVSILVEGAVPTVVAHEIGHALIGNTTHEAGTIMEGSGAYNAPNPDKVSSTVCSAARGWGQLKDISDTPFECCLDY